MRRLASSGSDSYAPLFLVPERIIEQGFSEASREPLARLRSCSGLMSSICGISDVDTINVVDWRRAEDQRTFYISTTPAALGYLPVSE